LILIAYAEAVAKGRLEPASRIPIGDVERWLFPNTNGDAHALAIADWRERGVLKGSGSSATVPLDEVAHAMIRYSDNAATDYVLRAVGGPSAVLAAAKRFGFRGSLEPPSIFGAFVAWATRPAAEWIGLSPAAQVRLARQLADATNAAAAAGLTMPSVETQASLAEATWLGTPRQWVTLMSLVERSVSEGTPMGKILSRHLQWPMEFAENAGVFDEFGTKGGDLPGVVTEATFIQAIGGDPLAIVLFLHGLNESDHATLAKLFTHQGFMRRLAQDPDLLRRTCAALA